MDNFTPDPSYCVDINPITWEASICKYTEHGKRVLDSFTDPDIKVEFRGCASHEFRVQPCCSYTRVNVHYWSYILEHQIADEEPVYILFEIINNRPRVSRDGDYKVLWNRAGRRKELVEKLSIWEQELPVELTFSYTDLWGGEVEDKWVLDNDEYYLRTPWQMTIYLFDKYKDVW
jgi:hypothetical protein